MIHRQILVVGGSGRKKTRLPFFCWSAGRIQPLLFLNCLLPTTLPCQNIKCNLYKKKRRNPAILTELRVYVNNLWNNSTKKNRT
ncbi:hypothetical protein [Aneurinibacillus migulanus]|uniref:hypothetical protein n=1 Tax=Aneurinibacillus migulanus TaxID=47500 RepID=UPI001F1C72F1|nr:hypothetical protein [Aneurinibacillus migulanus]